MRMMTRGALAATMALAASSVLVPAPAVAGAPPADKGDVQLVGTYCSSQDGFVAIGGWLKLCEFGRSGITRLRVKWLLYNTDLSDPGIHVAYKRKTQESASFPNDGRNFHYTNGKTWDGLVAADDGYTLVAKVTWVKGGRDWNKKYTITYCE